MIKLIIIACTFVVVVFTAVLWYGSIYNQPNSVKIQLYTFQSPYPVHDLSYQKEFPWETWKIRNRKLILKMRYRSQL